MVKNEIKTITLKFVPSVFNLFVKDKEKVSLKFRTQFTWEEYFMFLREKK